MTTSAVDEIDAIETHENSNPLYSACVGWMVSERTDEDSWSAVAKCVAGKVKDGVDVDVIVTDFKVTEKQIKKDFSITVLPTAWRTAKHTALKALREGVSLLHDDGTPKAKTALDKEIAALKSGAVPKNSLTDLCSTLARAGTIATRMKSEPALAVCDYNTVAFAANHVMSEITGIPHA